MNYTKWRRNLFEGLSGEEISRQAMEFQKKLKNFSEYDEITPIVKSLKSLFKNSLI
jgi:hypothetical protein